MKIIHKCEKKLVVQTSCAIGKKYCCRMMKKIFNDKYKSSFSDGSGHWYNAWQLTKDGIKIPIRQCKYIDSNNELITWEKIKYCPFCGTKIEVEHE